MTHTVDDLVDFILNDDALNAKDALDELVGEKLNDRIELQKFNLVNAMFDQEVPEEETEEEFADD